MLYIFLFGTIFHILSVKASNSFPSVTTKQGVLSGKYMKSAGGQQFSAYHTIPYAQPPIGNLRFKKPLPIGSWGNVLNASQPHSMCVQSLAQIPIGNEDCLYLSVYTPQLTTSQKKSYPVMVYIHGGGFVLGMGQLHGPDYFLDFKIILVTMNYRLGALGFFTTGDKVVPGNNGLKDQALAIKWVSKNIMSFGGDPKKITIFGESAGGSSVHLHQFSPLSQNKFQRAISQSGVGLCYWSFGKRNVVAKKGRQLAEALNCPTSTNEDMLQCLLKIEAYRFVKMDNIFMEWQTEPRIPFKPIVEIDHKEAFLVEHPIDLLEKGKANTVPWIVGVNMEEGALKVSSFFNSPQSIKDLDEDFNRVMSIVLEDSSLPFDEIRQYYFGNREIGNLTRLELVDLISDITFIGALNMTLNLHRAYSNKPVYQYLFGHKSNTSSTRIFGESSLLYGTSHGDELALMFPSQIIFGNAESTPPDKLASNLILTLWTNFAKTGNPTPKTNRLVQNKWEPIKTEDLEYSIIERNLYNSKNMYSNRMKFWKNVGVPTNYERKINKKHFISSKLFNL